MGTGRKTNNNLNKKYADPGASKQIKAFKKEINASKQLHAANTGARYFQNYSEPLSQMPSG